MRRGKAAKEIEMTEIDGSLLRGARYCVCCSLAAMKVNRGYDIEPRNKTDESVGMKKTRRWMNPSIGKVKQRSTLIPLDKTDYYGLSLIFHLIEERSRIERD